MIIPHPERSADSFSLLGDIQQELLRSFSEDRKLHESSLLERNEFLEKKREQRLQSLNDRLKQLQSGRSSCLKFIQTVTFVSSAITAPLGLGMSLNTLLRALGAIVWGGERLRNSLKQKEILLNSAEEKLVLSFIRETQDWIRDEQNSLDRLESRHEQSLDQFWACLKDLEQSLSRYGRRNL